MSNHEKGNRNGEGNEGMIQVRKVKIEEIEREHRYGEREEKSELQRGRIIVYKDI